MTLVLLIVAVVAITIAEAVRVNNKVKKTNSL